MKKSIIFCLIITTTLITTLPFTCKKEYIILFKRDGTLAHYNNNGQMSGEVMIFKNGVLKENDSYLNGFKSGWSVKYFTDGKIESKTYYKDGKQNGPEYHYYTDGKINYTANIYAGKRFGSFFWYREDGALDAYSVFDIRGETFCSFKYDKLGKIENMKGTVLSPVIYSLDEINKSVKLLKYREKYRDIKDLYVIAATPPGLDMIVNAHVNNKEYKNLKIKNNTIEITDAFDNKGLYNIFIESLLLDSNKKVINGINLEMSVIKE